MSAVVHSNLLELCQNILQCKMQLGMDLPELNVRLKVQG